MEEYKKRLIVEFKELNEKVNKLETFIDSSKFKELAENIVGLMEKQLSHMRKYLKCLYDRINLTITVKEIQEFDNQETTNK